MDNEEIKVPPNITFQDIRVRYHTGRFVLLSERDRYGNKVYQYRCGVMTDIGDLEKKVWTAYAEELVRRYGEETLFARLLYWVKEKISWLKNDQERREYALELHMSRIFDCPEWEGYSEFNRK